MTSPQDPAKLPVIQPANEGLRRPAPNVIDQRQQQIDPAGHQRADVNAPAADTMKQPGADPAAPATPDTPAKPEESGQ